MRQYTVTAVSRLLGHESNRGEVIRTLLINQSVILIHWRTARAVPNCLSARSVGGMSMGGNAAEQNGPRTEALRRALQQVHDEAVAADLLFLEHWQIQRYPGVAACLRAGQIRRANPKLAAEIHAELTKR